MRIPRDVDGSALASSLRVLGYQIVRREGSHMRLTTERNGEHHVTIPNHKPLKTGTLVRGILKPVALHHGLEMDALLQLLDL